MNWHIETIKDGNVIIFYCAELDISGYGNTITEAVKMFIEIFKDWFKVIFK